LKEWIKDPDKYEKYCDESLLLLKLGIYNNKILMAVQEDYNNFSKSLRRRLIDESESEGAMGSLAGIYLYLQ